MKCQSLALLFVHKAGLIRFLVDGHFFLFVRDAQCRRWYVCLLPLTVGPAYNFLVAEAGRDLS